MTTNLRPSAIVPPGFRVEGISTGGAATTIAARAATAVGRCPDCGSISARVHSHYQRQLADLPLAGRVVRISLVARRFRCMSLSCRRSIFTERFGDDVLAPHARRTARLDGLVHHLALALGGRPAAGLARRLMMPVSNDTLLRVVRRKGPRPAPAPTVIGIDDWAWKRNQRYGAIICDLERRRPIKLLPDREPATAQAWLAEQPQILIVARDRGGGFALAASKALPRALQVADRWHLMENASAAFLGAVRKSMRQIRSALGAAFIDPAVLTAAERLQYEGYLRREEINADIVARSRRGAAIKEIVRETGLSRGLVRKILGGQRSDIFCTRESSLEPHLPWLDAQWGAGNRNGADLWRRLRASGFRGSLRVVSEWACRRRRAERMDEAYPYGEGRLALTAACGDKSGKGGSMIVSTWNKWALIRMSGGRDGVPALAGRKRRAWTQDEKRRIVDESLADGASIAEVARRHDLNANQVFTWRRQIGGEPVAPKELTPILPVTIVAEPAAEESDPASSGQMEIVLAEGDRIIVWADVETAALTRVLKALARR